MGLLYTSILSYVVYACADVVHDEISGAWGDLAICLCDQRMYKLLVSNGRLAYLQRGLHERGELGERLEAAFRLWCDG